MANSTYGTSTLLGNYTELQSGAPPLRGVLPDYGKIDYTTTTKAEITKPQKSRQFRPERKNTVHRLITVEYMEEVAVGLPTDPNARFTDILANADPHKAPDESGHWETSAAASFGGRAPRRGRRAKQLQEQNQTGGAAAKGEKPLRQAGAYGERLREDSSNPKNDTRAQRSWVYGGANMFSENQASGKTRPRPKVQPTSLNIGGSGPATDGSQSFARKTTSITKKPSASGLASKGAGIWG
mmetsp:Transcript_37765/g.55639  ORF Transcript_37765/g.55639 Transcript_37765/m.55639 type:complete len:240 (+) Transcript_37765:72-791(+)